MSRINELREAIAKKASAIYGVEVTARNITALPVDKRNKRYCIVVYDNNLKALCESEPAEYNKAFERFLKKLTKVAHRP